MKQIVFGLLMGFFILSGIIFSNQGIGAEKKGEYLLPGDFKEGWKAFSTKKCSQCHSIWGEGGKGGPDLGTLPEHYVSQAQLAALMWNHGPEMWGKMLARKVAFVKIDNKEMADLFAFLYFIRYMDEPGDAKRGKDLMEMKGCMKCHQKEDLTRWGRFTNPLMWAQMMWNHAPQMEEEIKKKGLPRVEFKGDEMVDLIAYVRSISPKTEKDHLGIGDPRTGEKLFTTKGCIQCHGPGGKLDLTKTRDFPKTLAHLTGLMWNHSYEMWKAMEEKGINRQNISPQEMTDLIAYLFSTRYFDEPGDAERGKKVFAQKQCNLCHGKGTKMVSLAGVKGKISPILMAQAMWNHGPEMLEQMRKVKMSWQEITGKEMVDLMEYLNRGAL